MCDLHLIGIFSINFKQGGNEYKNPTDFVRD